MIGPLALGAASSSALADLDLKGKLNKDQFKALLQDMDSSVRALPATAQVGGAVYIACNCTIAHHNLSCTMLSACCYSCRAFGICLDECSGPAALCIWCGVVWMC